MADETAPSGSTSSGDDEPTNGILREEDPQTPDYFPGEKDRPIPRSAWWILGLAAALLLAFVVVRPVWFRASGDSDSIADLDVPADRHFTKTLAGLGRIDGTWLTDDSSSTSFLVSLPVDSAREDTRLRLTGTTQVAEDSTAFITVAMDGQQVYEAQLPHGNNPLDAAIAIPAWTAEDGHVRVRVSTHGILHTAVCTPDQSPGTVIHLDPGTVVEAALSDPVHTVRDALAALNRTVTVVLTDQSDEWRSTAADVGIRLTRAGYDVAFSETVPESGPSDTILLGPAVRLSDVAGWTGTEANDDGSNSGGISLGTIDTTPVLGIVEPQADLTALFLSTAAATTADTAISDPQALVTAPAADPASLAAHGADLTEVEITDSHTWTVGYSIADLPDGRLPEAVRVDLRLPASPADLTWILNVTLNGQLVDSRRLDSPDPVVVPLPPATQLLANTLKLTVQRDRDLGGCDVRPTSYPIQLLGTSGFVLGDEPGAGFTAMPRDLATGYTVYFPDTESSTAIELLNASVPVIAEIVPSQSNPGYQWNTPPVPGTSFVVVGSSSEVATVAHVEDGRLTAGSSDNPVLDLSSFENGAVIQCATGPGASRGLSIQAVGEAGRAPLPSFGRECVNVATPGGTFSLDAEGALVSTNTPR